RLWFSRFFFFFFKQKTAYEFGLGIPAEPLFRSNRPINILCRVSLFLSMALCLLLRLFVFRLLRLNRFSTLTLKVLLLIPILLSIFFCMATFCLLIFLLSIFCV